MITSIIILLLAAGAFAFWRSRRSPAPTPIALDPVPVPPFVAPPAPPPLPSSASWLFIAGDDPDCRAPVPPPEDPRRFGMTIFFEETAPVGCEFVGTRVNSDEAASLIADINGGEFVLPADRQLFRYYAIAAEGPRYVRRREVRGDQRGPWQYLGDVAPYLRPTG